MAKKKRKRKSGVPTGNAGEYFVMGELLRQGFDAALADRNTKGYDLLAGSTDSPSLKKVQVKTARKGGWFVKTASFKPGRLNQVTVYVLLGPEKTDKPVRFFIAKNHMLKKFVYLPSKKFKKNAIMPMKAVAPYEDKWGTLR